MTPLKRPPLTVLTALAIFVMGALGLTAYTLWLMRADAIKNGLEISALLSKSFENHLTQNIHVSELAGVNAVPAEGSQLNLRQIERDFASILRNSPSMRSISLLDDGGRVIASSNHANLGMVVATAGYFPVANGNESVLRIGPPWAGRDFAVGRESSQQAPVDTPETFIPIAKTMMTRGWGLTLLIALNTGHFLQHMTMQFQHRAGSVAVMRLDGTLLMDTDFSHPLGAMRAFPSHTFQFNEVESGQFQLDRDNGGHALAAFNVSSLYPFAIVTLIDREQALSNWRYQVKTLLGIVGPTLLGLVFLVIAFHRRQLLLQEQRAKSQRLQQINAAKVFTNSQEGILITTADGTIIDVNDAFVQITGYSREEAVGKNPRLLSSGRQDKAFFAAMWHHLKEHGFWRGEVWNRRRDGEVYVEELTISAVRDEIGEIRQYVGQFSDISMRKKIEESVHQLAFYDPLTRLPNRRLLGDRLSQVMATSKRSGLYGALMFLDLDNFKPLNDFYGHGSGDLLLTEVANRLTACVREIDTVARFGGDEFVVLLGELDVDRDCATQLARSVAEKISSSLAAPYQFLGPTRGAAGKLIKHQCSASIGVVIFLAEETNQIDILERADKAMYLSKQSGKNSVWFYVPEFL